MTIGRCFIWIVLLATLPRGTVDGQAAKSLARADARSSGSLLARPSRLKLHTAPLAVALVALYESSGVPISFSPSQLRGAPESSCACESAPVAEALATLLAGTQLTFEEVAGVIVVKLASAATDSIPTVLARHLSPRPLVRYPDGSIARIDQVSFGQTGVGSRWAGSVTFAFQDSILGTVVDGRSRPIASATVAVVGTGITASTDARGRFRLTNVAGAQVTIRVSAIGYAPLTQTTRPGSGDVTLVLSEMPVNLDELVVTGTAGETQRRALGNAVSRVNIAEVTELSVANDVGKLLNGRAPGVSVVPASGKIGAGAEITIRGRSTLSLSSQPLLYIDGARVVNDFDTGPPTQGGTVVSRMNDISPEDIESIEIIKGPAAATLYGTEAANGVIQIITKRERRGNRRWKEKLIKAPTGS